MNISGGTFTSEVRAIDVRGGASATGSAKGNSVVITGGNFTSDNYVNENNGYKNLIAGGWVSDNALYANCNSVIIAGGNFNDKYYRIVGGGKNTNASEGFIYNTVNLYGTVTGLGKAHLYGRYINYGDENGTSINNDHNELHIGGTTTYTKPGDEYVSTVKVKTPFVGNQVDGTETTRTNKVGSVNNFSSIVLHNVDWSTTTPVLAAGSFTSTANLDISGMSFANSLTPGTMKLLQSDNADLGSMTLTYNDTEAGTNQSIGTGISLGTLSLSGTDTTTPGVAVAFDKVQAKVTRSEDNKAINYSVSPEYATATLGAMNWGEGYTFASDATISSGGLAVSFDNDNFAVTGAADQANGATMDLLTLPANSDGVQSTVSKDVTVTLADAAVTDKLTFSRTRTDTASASAGDKKVVYTTGAKDKVTTATFDGAIAWNTTTPYYNAAGSVYTFDSSTAINAAGLTISTTSLTDAQKAALKKDGNMTLISASGITESNNSNITQPTSNTVAISTRVSGGNTFTATAVGTVAAETGAETGAVKYKISSIDVNTVTLGSSNKYSLPASLPDTWTASNVTTIDASNFNFLSAGSSAGFAVPIGQKITVLNGTGLANSTVTQQPGEDKGKLSIPYTTHEDIVISATATGTIEPAEDKLNYVVDAVEVSSVNLKEWNGTADSPTSSVPTGWTAQDGGVDVYTNNMTKLPTNLAPGGSVDILTGSAGFFTDTKIQGANKYGNGDAFNEKPTGETGIVIAGYKVGGVKAENIGENVGVKLTYYAEKKSESTITLGTETFTNGGTVYGGAASEFTNMYDATGATINTDDLAFSNSSVMEAGDSMTVLDASKAIKDGSGHALPAFTTTQKTSFVVGFTDEVTDKGLTFKGTHTDTLSQDSAQTKILYTVGSKTVSGDDAAALTGAVTWSGGGTHYTNTKYTFDSTAKTNLSGLTFGTTNEDPYGKSMTLISGSVAGTVSNAPVSFGVSLAKTNTTLEATAAGSAAIDSGDLKYTVNSVTIDKINVKKVDDETEAVPTGWALKKSGSTIKTTVETGEGNTAMTPPSGLNPGDTRVVITAGESLEGITINGDFKWKADGSSLPTAAVNGVAVTGTQSQGGVKVDEANKNRLIYEETKKKLTSITLGEVTFANGGTARTFDNTYDATEATINADDLKFTETSSAAMETGNTMTIVDASAAFKDASGAALVAFADKTYTLAFSETNTEKNVTVTGTHTDTLSQDGAKTKLTYTVGPKDVKTVDVGKVDFVKDSTLFDRSGAGYNYAGVTALGTDDFNVSYASPENVAAGDSMTLLKANATLTAIVNEEKTKAYRYSPVTGVTIDANITGRLTSNSGAVTYTAAANQASKLTFGNVEWKDSGALMTRPSNITFAGADVDTTKIGFTGVTSLEANQKMTLVSDFGDSVGTITGTKYTVGAGLEGEGAASLSGSDLIFTVATDAKDENGNQGESGGGNQGGGKPAVRAQAQTHNTLMVMEAGMAVLASGREHVGQALAGLADPLNEGLDGTVIGASMGGSASKYTTGSHVDSHNWNVAVAVGSKRDLKKGSLEWGVFGEYGKSSYTLHGDAGRGDGDSHYAGGGLLAKWTNKYDVYTEASVRMGRLSDSANNLLWDAAGNGYGYNVHANYFGAHVGIGKIINYKGGKSLDVYGKYFYTKRGGVDFEAGGNNYNLDSVASSILRIGTRYGTTDKKWNWYGGLAYEYEFDGKSEGLVDGVAIRAASIKGSSVRAELGMRMSASKSNPWQADIGIYGYGGKHRGFGGSVNVAYTF